MKRSFIRVLWGEQPDPYYEFGAIEKPQEKALDLKLRRRIKINEDIRKTLKLKIQIPFVTYVFGEKNYKQIKGLGLPCEMVDDNPDMFGRHSYKHKLFAFSSAMKDFDEIVFLDWDTKPKSEIPNDFWDSMYEKDIFQSSLWKYETLKIKHRKGRHNKYISSGGVVYMRDKKIPSRLLELHLKGPNKWSEEPAYCLLVDEIMGGWKGLEEYFKRFELDSYTARKSPYRLRDNFEKCPEKILFENKGKPWSF